MIKEYDLTEVKNMLAEAMTNAGISGAIAKISEMNILSDNELVKCEAITALLYGNRFDPSYDANLFAQAVIDYFTKSEIANASSIVTQ